MYSKNEVENIRSLFPVGTRIRLIQMDIDPQPVPGGSLGTVDHIDDIGTLHMKWDNGRSLGLIYGLDEFETIVPAVK